MLLRLAPRASDRRPRHRPTSPGLIRDEPLLNQIRPGGLKHDCNLRHNRRKGTELFAGADLMIDLQNETIIAIQQVPDMAVFAHRPKRLTLVTIYSWMKGLRGVRLETVMIAGRRCTTTQAVERFIYATSSRTRND